MISEYKTIRYMKKKNLHLTKDNSSEDLRTKMKSIDSETNLVVKLKINSPVYVEDALELNHANIHKISKQIIS